MHPKLSNDKINLLNTAFAQNSRFSDWLADEAKVPISMWLDYVDILSNMHNLPVLGIQAKLSDIGDPEKLPSTLSELKAAKVLAERGFEVELLLDGDRRFQSPPDLLANRQGPTILVEVKRVFADDNDELLYQKLQPLLEKRNFILTVKSYPEDIFNSAFESGLGFVDRDGKKKLFESFASDLLERLESLDQSQLPCNISFEDGSSFSVKSADLEKGLFPQIHMPWRAVPVEKYQEKILEKLYANNKTLSKRAHWSGEYLKHPFLIFLDLGHSLGIYKAIFSALYGLTTCVEETYKLDPQHVSYPEFVMSKLKGEQKELLLKLGFDARRRFHISRPGYFVTDESVRRNTTGVLTMLHDKVECFPNPFCDESIFLSNLSEYLDVPLTSSIPG